VRHDARESRALFLFVFKLSTNAGIGAHARSHSDGNNERCTFAVQQTTQLSVTEWSIRNGDYLTVGGTQYSDGDNGALNGVQVTAGSQINWYVFLCCVVLCCVVLCCVVLCCVVLCCVVLFVSIACIYFCVPVVSDISMQGVVSSSCWGFASVKAKQRVCTLYFISTHSHPPRTHELTVI
jgi:hypothetical protein